LRKLLPLSEFAHSFAEVFLNLHLSRTIHAAMKSP
jgi:hypothetical protein